MPHLQGAATNARSQITLTGHPLISNDTTVDVWPIWVANSTAAQNAIGVLKNAIGMPNTPATHRAIQAGLQAATGTNQIWTIWNETYTSTATIPSGTITAGPTLVGTSSAEIWRVWNNTYGSGTITIGATMPARQVTEAERQARAADDARWRERNAAIKIEEAKAKVRAEKLLQESLDAKQREELAAKGYFELDVISKNGNSRRYRIHRQWSHSIHQIDPSNGKRLKTLCIHPREMVPIEDSMLAQKLMLESGMEDELLRIANHS